ncbi:unnamed protein product [Closterium sp. NIES-54]
MPLQKPAQEGSRGARYQPCSGRLNAGWAQNFFTPFPLVARAAAPFPRPGVSLATWSRPCVSAPTAATGVSADPALAVTPPSTGPTSSPTAAAVTTAVCACGASTATSDARSCSSTSPCIS